MIVLSIEKLYERKSSVNISFDTKDYESERTSPTQMKKIYIT